MSESKRLFVGGLAANITEEEVKGRFSRFGEVGVVEIKIKDDVLTGGKNTFAYVDMTLSQDNLSKCMTLYNHCKWKGKELRIQIAKDNFMQKLQKERVVVSEEVKLTEDVLKSDDHDKIKNMVIKKTLQGTPVENMPDWVVGKRGQILPIVHIRRKDRRKIVKVDPSMYSHNNKFIDDKSKGPSVEPVNNSVNELTWKLEERAKKHLQDIAHDSTWKPPKKSPASRRNISNYGSVHKHSVNISKNESDRSSKQWQGKSNCGTIDFNSDSSDNVTTNNSSSEDTDEVLLRRSSIEIRQKSQAKIRSQRAEVHRSSKVYRSSEDSSDDTDDVTSSPITSPTPKKRMKKVPRDSIRKADISSNSYDSSGSSSGSNIIEEEITTLPKWLESESDSESEANVGVTNESTVSDIVHMDTSDSSIHSDSCVKPTVGVIHQNVKSQISNSTDSAEAIMDNSSSSVESSSDSDDTSAKVSHITNVLSTKTNVLPSNSNKLPSHTTSLHSPISNESQVRKRLHDSQVQQNSLAKVSKVVSKSPKSANSSFSNGKLLEEFSSGLQQSTKENDSSDEEELDIFELIESGRINKLYESSSMKHQSISSSKQLTNSPVKTLKPNNKELSNNVEPKIAPETKVQKVSEVVSTPTAKSKKMKTKSKTKVLCTAERQELSNQKRLDSLKQRLIENRQQKSTVQKALASVDSTKMSNKKIVFDSDEDLPEPELLPVDKAKNITKSADSSSSSDSSSEDNLTAQKPKKPRLFEEDSGDSSEEADSVNSDEEDSDEDRFKIRPEFEGKSGKKLLDRQARFGNDSRFKMDARFVESDSDSDDQSAEEDVANSSVVAENDRALDILRTVVGAKGIHLKKQERKMFKDINTLHYDPAQESHKQFELPEKEKEISKNKESKKTKKIKAMEEDQSTVVEAPEVSGEKFYDVSKSLKDLFTSSSDITEENKPFSLLSSFGKSDAQLDDQYESVPEEISTDKPSTVDGVFPWQQPLAYVESSEEEDSGNLTHAANRDDPESKPSDIIPSATETFFLQLSDPQVQESLNFFRSATDKEEMRAQWLEARPALVDAYRMKRKYTLRQGRATKRLIASKRGRQR